MNELDLILIIVILFGVIIGWRLGLVRVLISIVGLYITVLVAGYAYAPMARTLSDAFGLGLTMMSNFSYFVALAVMTALVEVVSRLAFEDTRIPALRGLDKPLGGVLGIFYGVLWASLLLVPAQYGVAVSGGVWTDAIQQSALVPTLNEIFRVAVLDLVRPLFIDGIPTIYKPTYLI